MSIFVGLILQDNTSTLKINTIQMINRIQANSLFSITVFVPMF
jgi:hypothetical protein